MVPTFEADAVGGVAAVGNQADLLAHLPHGVDQRHGRGDGQFRADGLAPLVVAGRVEVEQHGGAGQGRGLLHLAVQGAGAGGGGGGGGRRR